MLSYFNNREFWGKKSSNFTLEYHQFKSTIFVDQFTR